MKEKVRLFKLMLNELYEYKPITYMIILLRIIMRSLLPLLQLLLSALVIEWLISEITIREYLIRLSIVMVIVGGTQVADRYFSVIEEEYNSRFREDHAHKKISKKYLSLDYPKIIGKEAQEKYNKANELTWNNGKLFGRWIKELIDLGSSFIAILLYISILTQLESLFIVVVTIFLLIVISFNILQVKLDKKIFSKRAAVNGSYKM
jgi:ATP-binding cassette subfamily B protein